MDCEDAGESEAEELIAAVAMSLVPGIGPRLQSELLAHFQTARNVMRQSVAVLQSVSGISARLADRIAAEEYLQAARDNVAQCHESGVNLLRRDRPGYPNGLTSLCDAPVLLYARGDIRPQDELAVAIVGSRRCTVYGRRQSERLAGSLVRAGFTVISGLARGIDAAAHRGALNAGGRTIAVMATGVREIYPPEHAELAMEIIRHGALVSEFPPGQKPRPGLFPQRNRIISGMSLGVIIVEATRSSGALYTARHAMEQGREVFAVPGPVDSVASEGCHELIRDGVTLVRTVDDVLKELGPLRGPAVSGESATVHDPREMSLNVQEKEVLNLIGSSPVPVDEVLRTTQLDLSRVLSTLTVLEMKRFIRRLPGNMVLRNI